MLQSFQTCFHQHSKLLPPRIAYRVVLTLRIYNIDLFIFYAKHQVIVCKLYACAITCPHLSNHIKNLHAHEACRDAGLNFAKFRVNQAANTVAEFLKERYSLLNPRTQRISQPLPTDPPLPDLKLYHSYQYSYSNFTVSRSKSSQRSLE
jgi:hypothetical protein